MVLLVLAPGRDQLGAAAIAVLAGVVAAVAASLLPGVESLEARLPPGGRTGLMLAASRALRGRAAAALTRLARGSRGERSDAEPAGLLRRRGLVAALALLLIIGAPLAAAAFDDSSENA